MSHCSLSGEPPWLGSQSELLGEFSQRAKSGSFGGCAATLAEAGAVANASAATKASEAASAATTAHRAVPTALSSVP